MASLSKLAPQLRRKLLDDNHGPSARLTLLVSFHSVLSEAQQLRVASLGGRLRSAAGAIATLELPMDALVAFSDLEFVQYIEDSTPQYDE